MSTQWAVLRIGSFPLSLFTKGLGLQYVSTFVGLWLFCNLKYPGDEQTSTGIADESHWLPVYFLLFSLSHTHTFSPSLVALDAAEEKDEKIVEMLIAC